MQWPGCFRAESFRNSGRWMALNCLNISECRRGFGKVSEIQSLCFDKFRRMGWQCQNKRCCCSLASGFCDRISYPSVVRDKQTGKSSYHSHEACHNNWNAELSILGRAWAALLQHGSVSSSTICMVCTCASWWLSSFSPNSEKWNH